MPRDLAETEAVKALRSLRAAAARLGESLALIGGVAVAVRGVPRYTKDIDAILWQGEHSLQEVFTCLQDAGFEPRIEGALAFARQNRVIHLRHTETKTPVDVVLAAIPFEREALERATPVLFSQVEMSVVSAEDLIILKRVAGRPQDHADIHRVVEMNSWSLDKARIRKTVKEFADVLESPEMLDAMERLLGLA